MNIVKKEDHYLFSNELGEYHLSLDQYDELGKERSIEFVKEELLKKSKGIYKNKSIDFAQARDLGFCEYGIKDFCQRLKLDIDAEYSIKELYDKLDVDTFVEYPSECLKLFTDKLFDKFGGISKLLNEHRSKQVLNLVINHGNIEDNVLHEFSYKCALNVLDNFEKEFPNDDRPRKAIEAKKAFIEGRINKQELELAESATWSAVRSAAWSAAWSEVRSAAWSAARSAAWAAACSAASATRSAWSAVRSADSADSVDSAARAEARSAEVNFQVDLLLSLMNKKERL